MNFPHFFRVVQCKVKKPQNQNMVDRIIMVKENETLQENNLMHSLNKNENGFRYVLTCFFFSFSSVQTALS